MNPREMMAATVACGLAGEVVRTFGEVRLRVFGTSMAPAVLPGDVISVRRVELSEISCGAIVLYEREGGITAHRVVGYTGSPGNTCLITRGDRLRHNDPPVSSSDLLGKVISVERNGRQAKTTFPPGAITSALTRLLQSSDKATYLYVKLASLCASIAQRTNPNRRLNNKADSGRTIDGRLGSSDTERVAKCRA